MLILDAANGDDIVIDSLAYGQPHGICKYMYTKGLGTAEQAYLELCHNVGRNRVQGDQDGQLLGGARIAERMG